MKPRILSAACLTLPLATALAALAALAAPLANAANVTWTGATDMFWTQSDSTSWDATYNSGDSALFTGSGTGTVTISGAVTPLSVNVSAGSYTFSGDSLTTTGDIFVTSTGSLTLSNNVTVGNTRVFAIGTTSSASTSAMVVNSGVLNVGAGGGAVIIGGGAGSNGSGKGSLVINGGTVNVGAAGTSAQGVDASNLWLNAYGTTGASARIDLNGGMLSTARTIKNGAGFSTTAVMNLNGGTLQAAGSIELISNVNDRIAVNVLSGGAIIDTQAFNASISEILRDGGGGGGLTKNGTGTLTLSAINTYTGITTVSAGTLALGHATDTLSSSSAVKVDGATAVLSIAGNSDTVGAVSLKNGGSITGSGGTLTGASYAVESGSVSAKLGGAGIALTKSTAGTVTLSGANTYSGATTVSAGTLAVNGTGSINDSAVTVNGGTFRYNSSVAYSGALTYTSGTVGGTNLTGSLNNLTISSGQTLSPGNSPGTATTGSQTWAGGGTYDWEINDANATAGADPGWDLLSGTGTLTISATSGSQFNLNLYSLSLLNVAGSLTDFNNANSYNWLIADFAAVSGFSANAFNVIDTNFSNNNTLNGTFGVALGDTVSGGDNSQIYLTYTSIPEPRAALLGGLGLLALLRRRR